MSNVFAANSVAGATRVPVWAKAPDAPLRFTAWGAKPVNDDGDYEEPAGAYVDPEIDVEQARTEAFGEGYAAGIEAGRREADAEREALRKLVIGLEMLRPEPTQGLGRMIADTVERLLNEVMGEVEVSRDTLIARAQAAAELIGEETRPSVLKLNAADVARLDGADLPVALGVDPSLGQGEMRLETGSGSIEDGPRVRLERLRASLDRIAG